MTITQAQCLLKYLGYYTDKVDGVKGPNTTDAVKAFQTAQKLATDGICGATTEEALVKAVANGDFKKEQSNVKQETTSASTSASPDKGWEDIKYFKRSEFACKCGKYCNGFPAEPDMNMVRAADAIRARLGKPLNVNSGLRCQKHNAAVGGASQSQHKLGTACDLGKPAGVTPAQMAAIAEDVLNGGGGIGIYSWGIHIDTRKNKYRWNG